MGDVCTVTILAHVLKHDILWLLGFLGCCPLFLSLLFGLDDVESDLRDDWFDDVRDWNLELDGVLQLLPDVEIFEVCIELDESDTVAA